MVSPCGEQRRLVDEVRQVGADHAGRRRRDPAQVDVRAEREPARVHRENRLATLAVRGLHRDAPVEPAGAEQGRIEDIGPVRGGDHHHGLALVEAVHLDEKLVEGLLPLVVAATETGAALATDGIELVDEDH